MAAVSLLERINDAEAELADAVSDLDAARARVERAEKALGDLIDVPDHL